MNSARDVVRRAETLYEDLISIYKDYPDDVDLNEKVINHWRELDEDPSILDAIIFVGAAFPGHFRRPRSFHELAMRKEWSLEWIQSIGTEWFIHHGEDFGERIPPFVQKRLGDSAIDGILLEVIRSTPDESNSFIEAVRRFVSRDLTPNQIARFRTLWDEMSEPRREAIAIALATDRRPYELPGRILVDPPPAKIDLLTRRTNRPSEVTSRPRWIDQEFSVVRPRLWSSYAATCADFAQVCDSLGDERGQVSALLEKLRLAPSVHAPGLRKQLASLHASLAFDRYVFSAAEENKWGPDFALLLSYTGSSGISLNRCIIFQAKLIKSGNVRIPVDQLAALLKSSWHSSFYLFWCSAISPRCISAALLKELMNRGNHRHSGAKSPSVRWAEVSPYTDSLAALLGDRFLCAELGDDPKMPSTDSADIARRIAKLYGYPRFGVLSISAAVGKQVDRGGIFGETRSI